MIKKTAESTDDVVADAATIVGKMVRHELPDGTTISHIFDGDEEHRRTCQWRVVAQSEQTLRDTVFALIESLNGRGIQTLEPHFLRSACYVIDRGPW